MKKTDYWICAPLTDEGEAIGNKIQKIIDGLDEKIQEYVDENVGVALKEYLSECTNIEPSPKVGTLNIEIFIEGTGEILKKQIRVIDILTDGFTVDCMSAQEMEEWAICFDELSTELRSRINAE